MKKIRYCLKFVNNGEPFLIPNWTSEKHEEALAKLAAGTKDMDDVHKNREFKFYVIHETLITIDPDCKLEDIRNMHATPLIELFGAVYDAGRESIYYADFRKEGKKKTSGKKSKSTGTKNSKSSKN